MTGDNSQLFDECEKLESTLKEVLAKATGLPSHSEAAGSRLEHQPKGSS
jgi:hypothetical protein